MERREFGSKLVVGSLVAFAASDSISDDKKHSHPILEFIDILESAGKNDKGIAKCVEHAVRNMYGCVFLPFGEYNIQNRINTNSLAIIGLGPSHPTKTTKGVIFNIDLPENFAGAVFENVKHVENIFFRNISIERKNENPVISIRPFKTFVVGCNFNGFQVAIKRSKEGNGGCSFMRILNNGFFNCKNALVFEKKGGIYHNLIIDDNYFISGSISDKTGYSYGQKNTHTKKYDPNVSQLILPGRWLGGSISRNLFEQLNMGMKLGRIQGVIVGSNYFEAVDVDAKIGNGALSDYVALANYYQSNNCFVTLFKKNRF